MLKVKIIIVLTLLSVFMLNLAIFGILLFSDGDEDNEQSEISSADKFDDDIVQDIMNEALKYEGYPYVFGGSSPSTSFDCSGLIQWSYATAGITLPRTAQQQYDATIHIPMSEAKAGDLVFFHSTYNAGTYITHVGIYVGNNQMYHAGDPIGYADLTNNYWIQHIVGAGRINK